MPIQAFTDAYGWGAESVGGRGGRIIEVTNLNDDGPGSFREAVESSGPRIVVFLVAGTIRLLKKIFVGKPFLTIDAFTAPGLITLTGDEIFLRTHDIIIHNLAWRVGKWMFRINPTTVTAGDKEVRDIIINHCSMSGNTDDFIQINFDRDDLIQPDLRNITIQNSIIALSGDSDATGVLVTGGNQARRDRLHHITIHNNLFHSIIYRCPAVRTKYNEVLNNVVYNWNRNGPQIGYEASADVINNYLLPGPMTDTENNRNGAIVHQPAGEDFTMSLYVAGNIIPDHPLGPLTDPLADNWPYVREQGNYGVTASRVHQRLTPLDEQPPFPVPLVSAEEAFVNVLENAGTRDAIDLGLISEITGEPPPPPPEEPMSVITDLEAVETALRSEVLALTAQADAIAQVIIDLKAVDDVLDAAADAIEVD